MQSSSQVSRSKILSVVTIVAILSAIGINALSNFFPINGLNIGEISNQVFAGVLVTPANYAFAIWGVIYLGILAFGIYQLLPNRRDHSRIQKLRFPIIGASIFQSFWIFQFQSRNYWASVILMIGILLSLITAFLASRQDGDRLSREEKWLIQIPFSIYLGWISVASIVNIASALYSNHWDGLGISPVIWTVLLSAMSTAIAVLIILRYKDIAFTSVILWALVAIAARQASQPTILITTSVCAIGLALLILLTQLQSRPQLR